VQFPAWHVYSTMLGHGGTPGTCLCGTVTWMRLWVPREFPDKDPWVCTQCWETVRSLAVIRGNGDLWG